MERAHRHASELTKSSIDIDGDVEVIAAATDHLQVKLQCRPRSLRREQQTLAEVGTRKLAIVRTRLVPIVHSLLHGGSRRHVIAPNQSSVVTCF